MFVNKRCNCHPDIHFRFVLSDFGFTKVGTEPGVSSSRRGTDRYRAPELIKWNEFSYKTDIWSFGCLLMEIASSGKRIAFRSDYDACRYADGAEGHSLPQLESSHNPELNEPDINYLNSILTLCLQSNPENRPSIEKLLKLLNIN